MAQEGDIADGPGGSLIYRGGRWYPHKSAAPAQKPSSGFTGYIPGVPKDPTKAEKDIADLTKTNIDIQRAPTQIAKDQTDLENANFKRSTQASDRNLENAGKMVDDYRQEQPVKDYMSAIGVYGAAMKREPTPQGDLALVYDFAKVMDPGSVVREGEMGMATSASPIVAQIMARYGKELQSGGSLPPEARQQMKMEMANKMASLNQAFIGARVKYKEKADRFGINPLDVVGEHPGLAYQQEESAMLGRPVSQADYRGNVVPQEPTGSVPTTTGGGDEPTGGPSFTNAQTQQVAQFLATNPSPEQYKAYLEAISGGKLSINIEDARATVEGIKKGAKFGGFDYDWEAQQKAKIDAMAKERDTVGGAVDATARGVADVVTMGFADEISALGDTVVNGKTYDENLNNQRMIDKADAQANPWARFGGQAAGGVALPIGKMNSVGNAVGKGAAVGAAYGFGSGEGDMGDRAVNALGGAAAGATGGALGFGVGKAAQKAAPAVGNALARLGNPTVRAERNALMEASKRQGVELLPADVGGAGLKGMTSAAGQSPFSANSVSSVARRAADQMGEATQRAGANVGKALPEDQAGELIRQGGTAYAKSTRDTASRLYDKAQKAASGVRIKPNQATQVIDGHIARLSELGETNAPLIKSLEKLKKDIANGVSVTGIRDARTSLSQGVFDGKMRSSQEKTIYKSVIEALSGDIEAGLGSVGKSGAASMFKRADALWRDRIETIDDVLEPIIGKSKSGEDIVKAVEGMARGNRGGVKRLSGVMNALSSKERGDVAATIIERMGKAKAGAQNDAGDAFSPETFLTNWNQMSPAAKGVVFADKGLRSNLDDIAKLASAKRETGKLASKSNTPIGIAANVGLTGAVGFGAGGVPGVVLASLAQYGAGKLLSSKAFTSWLARAPRNASPAASKAYAERLSGVAAREPAMSAQIIQIQDYLNRAVAASPGKIAASEHEDN